MPADRRVAGVLNEGVSSGDVYDVCIIMARADGSSAVLLPHARTTLVQTAGTPRFIGGGGSDGQFFQQGFPQNL